MYLVLKTTLKDKKTIAFQMTLFLKDSKCTFSLNPTKSLEARTAGHPTAAEDLLLKTFMVTDTHQEI